MPQVINKYNFGTHLGSELGAGLSQGLNSLAERKMNQLMGEQQRRSALPGLMALGYDEKQAESISRLDPELQKLAVKSKLDSNPFAAIPGTDSYNQYLNHLIGAPEEGVPLGIQSQQQSVPGSPGVPGGVAAQRETASPDKASQGFTPKRIPSDVTPKQAKDLAELSLQKQKGTAEDRKQLNTFLKAKSEDSTNAKRIQAKAKSMRDNLVKNKDKFPGAIRGYIGHNVSEAAITDPSVRKYIADSNNLVTLLSQSRKGTPTNFKIKLEQASKPNISQPYETQLQQLNEILKDTDEVINTQQKIYDIRKQFGGQYPYNLEELLGQQEVEEQGKDLTKYAGSEVVQDDQGTVYKWDSAQNRYRPAKRKG